MVFLPFLFVVYSLAYWVPFLVSYAMNILVPVVRIWCFLTTSCFILFFVVVKVLVCAVFLKLDVFKAFLPVCNCCG